MSAAAFALQLTSPALASACVVIMGLLLTITGGLLLLATEYLPDLTSRVVYCCLALSCLLIAASTTHGLGGFLRYSHRTAPGGRGLWQFWQPFVGGTTFIATQAVGWSMFAATIVCLAVLVASLVRGVASCIRCWALGAGCMMFATQLVSRSADCC